MALALRARRAPRLREEVRSATRHNADVTHHHVGGSFLEDRFSLPPHDLLLANSERALALSLRETQILAKCPDFFGVEQPVLPADNGRRSSHGIVRFGWREEHLAAARARARGVLAPDWNVPRIDLIGGVARRR